MTDTATRHDTTSSSSDAATAARMSQESMRAGFEQAVAGVERPAAVLLVQDAAEPAWWEVSVDDGLTWHFFTSDATPAASLAGRFETVLSGRWDHATSDDWMDEEDDGPTLPAAERAEHEAALRRFHQQDLEREAAIAPSVTATRTRDYLAHCAQARRLLGLLDDLQTRLNEGRDLDAGFLQTVWDASGDLTDSRGLLGRVADAQRETDTAMCPFYAGFLWAGCDGPAVIARRLDLCVRRARAVLVAWLASGSAHVLAAEPPDRHNISSADVREHVEVLETVLCRVLEWIAGDDALREWERAAVYLRRQLRKTAASPAALSGKGHTRLAHTARKFLSRSETGFAALHESAYSACSA